MFVSTESVEAVCVVAGVETMTAAVLFPHGRVVLEFTPMTTVCQESKDSGNTQVILWDTQANQIGYSNHYMR